MAYISVELNSNDMSHLKKIGFAASAIASLALVIQCSANVSDGQLNTENPNRNSDKTDQESTFALDGFENLTVSEPVNYKNLQVFMISGETAADDNDYVTLKEAMELDLVKIIETSDVNELAITNKSDKSIFIHAGDIVRGGKQDRVLAFDMVIDPKAKKQKLESFCVESGRWQQRGNESDAVFESTTKMLSSRDMKIASKSDEEQGAVWDEVSEQQDKLSANVSYYAQQPVNVQDAASASSLELALDNEELSEIREAYKAKFENLITEKTIGFGYAINGEVYNFDIYNNRQLFLDLFDKLLTAAIVEAITELDNTQTEYVYLTVEEFNAALMMSENPEVAAENLNKRTQWTTEEDDDKILFTSKDRTTDQWLHKNFIVKSAQTNAAVSEPYLQLNSEQINANDD